MSRKLMLVTLALMAFCLIQIAPAMADDTKAAPAKMEHKEIGAKTVAAGMHHHNMASNEVAVCACGKLFQPNAGTKYIEANGKTYACCSDKCHELGSKDPAAAAKMAEENTAKFLAAGATATPAGK
jgi:hypothetical protein